MVKCALEVEREANTQVYTGQRSQSHTHPNIRAQTKYSLLEMHFEQPTPIDNKPQAHYPSRQASPRTTAQSVRNKSHLKEWLSEDLLEITSVNLQSVFFSNLITSPTLER